MARRWWNGTIALEGIQTGDGRVFTEGSLSWDTAGNGLAFRACTTDDGGHDGAVEVGRVTEVERRDGGTVWGRGWIDDENDTGAELIEWMEAAGDAFVSIDVDDVDLQVVDLTIEETDPDDAAVLAAAGDPDPGDGAGVVVYEEQAGDLIWRFLRARLRGLTAVQIPAFAEARITLEASDDTDDTDGDGTDEAATTAAGASGCGCGGTCGGCGTGPVVAAGGEWRPPRAAFNDPQLTRLTRLTVTEDGRVFGHVAPWGQCHVGYQGACVETPRSTAGYAWFRQGTVTCDNGETVAVGRLTYGGGHADRLLSYRGAIEHYDDAGACRAYVTAGEDAYGVWVAGVLAPGVTAEQAAELRAAAFSGDWRPIDGKLELVAVLAVNVPGFPIARVASGSVQALVAAGAKLVAQAAPAAPQDQRVERLAAELADLRRQVTGPYRRALKQGVRDRLRARKAG